MQRQNRFLLFLALTFLVWSLYLRLLAPARERPEDLPRPEKEAEPALEPPAVAAEDQPPPAAVPGAAQVAEREEQIVEVTTPLYLAKFSNRGGGEIVSFSLTRHRDTRDRPLEMVPQEATEKMGVRPLALELSDPQVGQSLRQALFQVSSPALVLGSWETGSLTFRWSDGRGLESTRKLDFSGDAYTIQVTASVRAQGVEIAKRLLFGPGLGEESVEGTYVQREKGVIQGGGELRLYSAEDIEGQVAPPIEAEAVGVASHYFAGLMIVPEPSGYGPLLRRKTVDVGEDKKQKRNFITAALVVPAEPARFSLFIGPKDRELLAGLAGGLEDVVEWGWFKVLVIGLRWALVWTHEHVVGNYGWAIVILTVAINLFLSPLKHYSYVSMRKMQKLAPQIKRIQERYKKLKPTDPRKKEMNTEVMTLYRDHKVSPFSGCLPVLLMIPFFYAFYRLLSVCIELRHAPFVLWVRDLSTYDPYYVLPILMGASQIIIQKMTPQTTADPVQAKMMMIMPVVFVVFFISAPSGLVLYWLVNNLVSLAQQVVTNRLVPAT